MRRSRWGAERYRNVRGVLAQAVFMAAVSLSIIAVSAALTR
jgi:hypothetical protein